MLHFVYGLLQGAASYIFYKLKRLHPKALRELSYPFGKWSRQAYHLQVLVRTAVEKTKLNQTEPVRMSPF
jgi:hypothetical protein